MTELNIPNSPEQLSERLRFLHAERKKFPRPPRRLSLTVDQRAIVLGKTAGRCHLCGGEIIDNKFAADHVLAHAAGGQHAIDNYLAAHHLCNGCRWYYSAEDFQWILRMGVWARKQMESETRIGREMLATFLPHERAVRARRELRQRGTHNSVESGEIIASLLGVISSPIQFKLWAGKPVTNTYGGKSVLDSDGEPVFAELAILRLLEQVGYKGVWVDTYRKCFRDAMPPAICELPPPAREVYDRIVAANGGTSGCWDVLAWKDGEYLFVESKRKGKDRMRESQLRWRDAAIRVGLKPESFRICEWDIEARKS